MGNNKKKYTLGRFIFDFIMGLLTAIIRSPVSGSLPTKGCMDRVLMAWAISGVRGEEAYQLP